jgi:alkanesulfonate monooxygenase SsuD/methylene tetrahydromethanopterin reductase-like flavin-dependent oxidoreductase (luciferase family)
MQFGVYTFVETRRDPRTGEPVDVDKSFADVMEQAKLADRVGLDVFGLGEHHRRTSRCRRPRSRLPRRARAPNAFA